MNTTSLIIYYVYYSSLFCIKLTLSETYPSAGYWFLLTGHRKCGSFSPLGSAGPLGSVGKEKLCN